MGQLNQRLPMAGARLSSRAPSGSTFPAPPAGYIYLTGQDGTPLVDADGAYLLGAA